MRDEGQEPIAEGLIVWVGHNRSGVRHEGKLFYADSSFLKRREFLGPVTIDAVAEVGRLRTALEPFAKLIEEIEAAKVQPRDDYLSLCSVYSDGSFWNHGHVNTKDLRVARAALSGKKEGE